MKQNLMLVARDNIKMMKKDLRKKQLKNLKAFDDEKKMFKRNMCLLSNFQL